MPIDINPIKPYLGLLKAAALAALVATAFIGGCNYGEAGSAKDLAAKDRELGTASAELQAAQDALDQVNAEAARQKAAAERARLAALAAEKAAAEAEQRMKDRQQGFARELADARKNPTCAALLNADLRRICGL